MEQTHYQKVSDYLDTKLWPEMNLFRERFGYLPEFPPKGSAQPTDVQSQTVEELKAKLQKTEEQLSSSKKDLQKAVENARQVTHDSTDLQRSLKLLESENVELREELANVRQLKEMAEEKIQQLNIELEEKESITDQGEIYN